MLETTPNLVVCISEGIHDKNGTFVCELAGDIGTDTFGHKMLTGSGKYLENLVKERIGVKVRSIELNVCQRCSSEYLSATDLNESAKCRNRWCSGCIKRRDRQDDHIIYPKR